MTKPILEVCVDSVVSAVNAKLGGANRLELCGDLAVGGVTPAVELFELVKENVDLPVHVLLRPRFGDFLYDAEELEMMVRQAKRFHELEADALVIGCLTKDGNLDWESMNRIMDAANGTRIHLHRAFDMCIDLPKALEQAKTQGIHTILTSGGYACALEGAKVLKKLKQNAGEISIMAGAGVNASVIEELYKKTGITVFHMSGKRDVESEMCYRNPKVNMGLPQLSEYTKMVTDVKAVRKAKETLLRVTRI